VKNNLQYSREKPILSTSKPVHSSRTESKDVYGGIFHSCSGCRLQERQHRVPIYGYRTLKTHIRHSHLGNSPKGLKRNRRRADGPNGGNAKLQACCKNRSDILCGGEVSISHVPRSSRGKSSPCLPRFQGSPYLDTASLIILWCPYYEKAASSLENSFSAPILWPQ